MLPSSSALRLLLLRVNDIPAFEDKSEDLYKCHYYTLSYIYPEVHKSATTELLSHHCSSEIIKDNDAVLLRTFCFPLPGFKSKYIIWNLGILRPSCIHMHVICSLLKIIFH